MRPDLFDSETIFLVDPVQIRGTIKDHFKINQSVVRSHVEEVRIIRL